MKNYYEILGVSPSSEIEVITAAYKAMMRKYHPDTNNSAQAAVRAKEINEAYEVLKNPLRRREYDEKMGWTQSSASQSHRSPPPPPPPAATNVKTSEPHDDGEKNPFVGQQGELQIWAIFAAAYIAIALLYFGPTEISVSLGRSPLNLAAKIAGAATLPFALGFIIAKLWKALASSASEPKTDRTRWLVIQFIFIAILVFNKSMLEKAREEEAAAATQETSLGQAVASEGTSKCHTAFEAQNWKEAWTFCPVAAESGDATSQSMIGYMHDQGLGAPKNAAEAVKWFRKAAEQGDEAAKKRLAELSVNEPIGNTNSQNTVSSESGSEPLKMNRSNNWSSDVRRLTSEIADGKINVRSMRLTHKEAA